MANYIKFPERASNFRMIDVGNAIHIEFSNSEGQTFKPTTFLMERPSIATRLKQEDSTNCFEVPDPEDIVEYVTDKAWRNLCNRGIYPK